MTFSYRFLILLLALSLGNTLFAQEAEKPASEETKPEVKQESAKEEEELPPQEIKVGEGRLMLPVPGDWKKVKPRSQLVEVEFSIPEAEEGVGAGRMTIMASGGTVKDNLTRWIGQFRTAEGGAIEEVEPVEHEVGELKITTLDLSGTYRDMSRGPFGPATELPDHRMLGAIIPTDGEGTYYVKLYGPTATIEKAAEKFTEMIQGTEWE
jgi:gluconolactonase